MAFFTNKHKKLAINSSREDLQRGYTQSEEKLRQASKQGDKKALKEAMKEHGNIEYAMLYQRTPEFQEKKKKGFPKEYPFWARLKISKNRTTLVIDEDKALNKKTKKYEDGFVHREATSQYHKGFEEVKPNPDKDRAKKGESMYLKSPRKLPQRMFEPHNKNLNMPQHLKDRYSKNNNKKA